MDGAGRSREIPLKYKHRRPKPKGRFRSDYNGNSGINRHKHVKMPAVPGIKRKQYRRKV